MPEVSGTAAKEDDGTDLFNIAEGSEAAAAAGSLGAVEPFYEPSTLTRIGRESEGWEDMTSLFRTAASEMKVRPRTRSQAHLCAQASR